MKNIITKIKSLIRQAIITLITDDSEKYPLMQVNYNGKTSYVIRVSPYGLCSNPGTDMFSLLFNSGGNESQKFGIPVDLLNRYKNLKEGEVVLHNSKARNYVYLRENGNVFIQNDASYIRVGWDGDIHLNGSANYAVSFNDLSSAFNNLLTKYNAHRHGGAATDQPSTADIALAKVTTVRLP
jgi:phage gp45-like